TAPLGAGMNPLEDGGNLAEGGTSPVGFLLANEQKPENLAANVSRVFLGVKLECAQCHDHPLARWSRIQFWEMAAFFRDVEPQPAPGRAEGQAAAIPPPAVPGTIKIPGTETVVEAKFLTGDNPNWAQG